MATDGRPPRDPRAAARDRRTRRGEVADPAIVLEAGAAYLATRPRSVAETRAHLQAAGYRPELIEAAIGRLLELAILDDRAFAAAWIESRDRTRPRSASALRRELQGKGIDEHLIETLLAGRDAAVAAGTASGVRVPRDPGGRPVSGEAPAAPVGDADEAAARRLLERKRPSLERAPDPARRRAKAWSLLARNGFGAELCARLLGEDDDRDNEGPAAEPDRGECRAQVARSVDPARTDIPGRSAGTGRTSAGLKRTPLRPGGALTRRTALSRGGGLSRRPPTR